MVRDHYLRRKLIEVGSRIVTESFDFRGEKAEQLVDDAEKWMFDIGRKRVVTEAAPAKSVVKRAMEALEEAHANKGALLGVPSGFRDLDRCTGGFRNSEMIVIAARPSKGKTALAMNMVEHVAVEKEMPVAVFSLEMTAEQLVMRMLSSLSKVENNKMRDGFTNERDHLALTAAATRLSKSQIYIDDSGALTILELRGKARRLKKQYDIRLFVVDYLQLLHGVGARRNDSRAQEVADISGGIKALAKELAVPFVVVSQLNREVEKREGGKPRLADLRESGAIEQDADVVLLLARGSGEGDESDGGDTKEKMETEADLIIAKQRNGPTGNVELTFLKQFTKFESRARAGVEYPDDRMTE